MRDVLGCAQTGTGKTASFVLPMVDMLAAGRARARMPRSLILEPTRELATQVAASFELYGKYHRLTMALLIGGESFVDQERKLDRGVDVLIATPGRLLDLHGRGKILLSDAHILVIDEADRMLDMGFIPDVERIVGAIAEKPADLVFLGDDAGRDPQARRCLSAQSGGNLGGAAGLAGSTRGPVARRRRSARQARCAAPADRVGGRQKRADLLQPQARRRHPVQILGPHGFDAAALHGDMPQPKRTETLERFKRGEIRLLVASDVAARGLDIKGMSHVFCFDVPIHAEDYVHRIGRTGRAGSAAARSCWRRRRTARRSPKSSS